MEMEPLDKNEITDLINMMFSFYLKTGSLFKIEEYAESVYILTDVAKLTSKDIFYFFKKNQDICTRIWFTQIPSHKKILNIYEDCPRKRRIYYPSYAKSFSFLKILNRTQSISFILDS